ncbi:MAG: PD40 domain-containing protein, partial [Acidobacteria bacterium]|nr:PD40 domain-containing protein [Acidobacteriota bacterium]
MSQPLKHYYEFGPFRLNAAERLLLRDGVVISLTPKAFDLLLVLVAQPGHLLAKEELMQAIWPDAIVEETNLAWNISHLRKALGDGENGERYIETVPRRGYRFVNQVRAVSPETSPAAESLVTVPLLQTEGLQVAAPEAVHISSNGSVKLQPKAADETPVRRERNWKIATRVFALLAMLALGAAYFKRSAIEPRAMRLAFVPPENLRFENGQYDYVRVSPDGQKIVFTGQTEDGKRQLWVRSMDATEAQPLPQTDGASEPFWSPDSRSIGFVANWKMKRIDLPGGYAQPICDAFIIQGATWNSAGVILYSWSGSNGLFQVPATGGEPQRVTSTNPARHETDHGYPWFLPDSRHFLFRVTTRGGGVTTPKIYVGSLDSKEVKEVLADASAPVYAPPGWLFFVRNGALMAQSFDADRLELKGEAISFTPSTGTPIAPGVSFSISESGVLIWQGSRRQKHQLSWFDREGNQRGVVGPTNEMTIGYYPRFSPDGRRVAFNRNDPQTRNLDVWVIDLASNIPVRLSSDAGLDRFSIWSPDSSRVAFHSIRAGANGIYQRAANGTGTDEMLLKGGYNTFDWSADGRFIVCTSMGGGQKMRRNISVLPSFGDRQPYEIINGEFDEHNPQLSPDGRWLAYASDDSSSYEIYVQSFTTEGKVGGDKKRISTNGGNCPRWRRDGKE